MGPDPPPALGAAGSVLHLSFSARIHSLPARTTVVLEDLHVQAKE